MPNLDAKEIEKRGRDLAKAATSNESASTLLGLLGELRSGVKASEEILRSTKIGIAVNKLKQHKDGTVAKEASDLVGKWRRDVKAGAGKGSPAGAKSSPGVSAAPSPSVHGSASKMGESVKEKSAVEPDRRNSLTDKVDTNQTGIATRDACLKLMYDGLAHMTEEPPSEVLSHAIAVEAAAYDALGPETSEPYKTKMRSLFQNLKNKSNPMLRQRVLSGEIAPERFVRMTLEELKSPERREEDKKMQKENMDKAMVAQAEVSVSDSLQCGKCKQKKVSYSQAQTRSADEPLTTFCACTVCGHRWKFS